MSYYEETDKVEHLDMIDYEFRLKHIIENLKSTVKLYKENVDEKLLRTIEFYNRVDMVNRNT